MTSSIYLVSYIRLGILHHTVLKSYKLFIEVRMDSENWSYLLEFLWLKCAQLQYELYSWYCIVLLCIFDFATEVIF